MNQPAKAQEPSMEEILASIRRIIADDDAGKPATDPEPAPAKPLSAVPPPTTARPPPPPPVDVAAMGQDDIDTMLAGFDAPTIAPAAAKRTAPAFEPEPEEDVLDLTEAMAAPPPPAATVPPRPVAAPPVFTTIGDPDVMFAESPEPPPPPPRIAPEDPRRSFDTPRNSMQISESPLIGSDTRAAVDAAFNSLAHTVLVQNARTLEDLVKEMLRPMLKSWLDDNLPSVVERLVRAEIDRVSRGRQ